MCNDCVFEHRTCVYCGGQATFCCPECSNMRICYKCNITLKLKGVKRLDGCPQCGAKLRETYSGDWNPAST